MYKHDSSTTREITVECDGHPWGDYMLTMDTIDNADAENLSRFLFA